ncbi:MAG: 4Fe-4S binding protein [Thermodesulfobacteriota bacterium]
MAGLRINGRKVYFSHGQTILDVAASSGIYIPHLCARAGMPPARGTRPVDRIYRGETGFVTEVLDKAFEGCGLCVVEVEGMPVPILSCSSPAREEMQVYTDSPKIREARRESLVRILERHPHGCLLCPEAAGCDRTLCSINMPEEERCCWKSGLCELQRLTDFVGIRGGLHSFRASRQLIDDNPLFQRDYSLCIGCLRCVTVCRSLAGKEVLGFVYDEDGGILVGTRAPSLKESGCIFCLACVEVCPTGAMKDKKRGEKRSTLRRKVPPAVFPSLECLEFNMENLKGVPACEGVYQLLDPKKELFLVGGTDDLRASLLDCQERYRDKVAFYTFEREPMFTTRERQIIQEHVKQHGRLPLGNCGTDDLY